MKQNWDLLARSSTAECLHENRIVVGYRQPKHLQDIFVSAEIAIEPRGLLLTVRTEINAKLKKCNYCPLLDTSGRIKSHYTDREYTCKMNVTCKSKNLIDLLHGMQNNVFMCSSLLSKSNVSVFFKMKSRDVKLPPEIHCPDVLIRWIRLTNVHLRVLKCNS